MSSWLGSVNDALSKLFSADECWLNKPRFAETHEKLAEYLLDSFDMEVLQADEPGVVEVALKFNDEFKGNYHLTCGVVPPEVWPVDEDGDPVDFADGHFKLFATGKMYEAFIVRKNYDDDDASVSDVYFTACVTVPVTEFFSIVEQVKNRIPV